MELVGSGEATSTDRNRHTIAGQCTPLPALPVYKATLRVRPAMFATSAPRVHQKIKKRPTALQTCTVLEDDNNDDDDVERRWNECGPNRAATH